MREEGVKMLPEKGSLSRHFLIFAMAATSLMGLARPTFAQNSAQPSPNDNTRQVDQQNQNPLKPWANDPVYQEQVRQLERSLQLEIQAEKQRTEARMQRTTNGEVRTANRTLNGISRVLQRGRGADWTDIAIDAGVSQAQSGIESAAERQRLEMELVGKIAELEVRHQEKLDRLDSRYRSQLDRAQERELSARERAAERAQRDAERAKDRQLAAEQRAQERQSRGASNQDQSSTLDTREMEQIHRNAVNQLYKNHVIEATKSEGKIPLMTPEEFLKDLEQKRIQQQQANTQAAATQVAPATPAPAGPK